MRRVLCTLVFLALTGCQTNGSGPVPGGTVARSKPAGQVQPSHAAPYHPDLGAPPQLILDAERGDADAQFNLGYLYFLGTEGKSGWEVSQLLRVAAYWFGLAASQGHQGARKIYDKLAAYH